jgi:hypothetical protein
MAIAYSITSLAADQKNIETKDAAQARDAVPPVAAKVLKLIHSPMSEISFYLQEHYPTEREGPLRAIDSTEKKALADILGDTKTYSGASKAAAVVKPIIGVNITDIDRSAVLLVWNHTISISIDRGDEEQIMLSATGDSRLGDWVNAVCRRHYFPELGFLSQHQSHVSSLP